jgi:AraC family transcriptional regulator of adaptative response / DNA-3-methyladenine glycosylase II
MVEALVKPRGPYSLALSARTAGDATRTFRDGLLLATFDVSGRIERAGARQQANGQVRLAAESDEGLELLRFVLALDDDHSPFLRLAQQDPLLRAAASHLAGLRPLRLGTVAHALLRALCGQLIEARQARSLERRIVRAAAPPNADRPPPPTGGRLGAFSPAELRALGLHARRGATLVRLCRSLDLERLRALPTEAVAERLERERGLGPWSVGVVCLQGLGRPERGLVGDLGLIKLLSALRRGGRVESWETAELLAPYGEWAGVASVYLLSAFARGLIELPLAA